MNKDIGHYTKIRDAFVLRETSEDSEDNKGESEDDEESEKDISDEEP